MKLSACDHSTLNGRNQINPYIRKTGCWDLLITEISCKEIDEPWTDLDSRLDYLWLPCDLGETALFGPRPSHLCRPIGVIFLYGIVRDGLCDKVTSKQKLRGSDGVNHVALWGFL